MEGCKQRSNIICQLCKRTSMFYKFLTDNFLLQVASVGEKHWRGFQSYLNDNGSLQNGEGNDDRQRSTDDDGWGAWDTKGDEDTCTDDKDKTDNGWDDAEWNSTWNTPKSKLKPKVNNSFTKKEDTSSNGWDNVDMDQWNDADWTPSKQRNKAD